MVIGFLGGGGVTQEGDLLSPSARDQLEDLDVEGRKTLRHAFHWLFKKWHELCLCWRENKWIKANELAFNFDKKKFDEISGMSCVKI